MLLVVALLLWLLLRKRTRPEPPAQSVARKALELLAGAPENGLVLSQISRIIKRYFAAAFDLPLQEMTTAEFSREIARRGQAGPGPEIAEKATAFLRVCDEQKFAPAPRPMGGPAAVATALELVSLGEKRREELRAAAPPQAAELAVQS